ncbi:MAG: hypothetical protein LQ342_000291 [Letrouitia transgressa]|nr:MAG: hypothetical protein LQ342_000291 [Letrouitia transgressa]
MMESSGKRSLLFVHTNGPTHVNRDKSVKAKIRRHVMADIGRARRKPPRNPKIDTILHLPTNLEEERVNSNGNVSDKASQNHLTPVPFGTSLLGSASPDDPREAMWNGYVLGVWNHLGIGREQEPSRDM